MMDTEQFESDIFLFDSPSETTEKKKKKKKKGKSKKIQYQKSMEKNPKSPYKCKTHSTQNLRLKETTKNPPNCKSCGIKLQGQRGYLACPKAANCFNLCSVCRICPQNHILRNCVSLKQFEGELYSKNKYKCDFCSVQKQVGKEGVLHCVPCSFSLCLQCVNQFNKRWEEEPEKEVEVIKQEENEQ